MAPPGASTQHLRYAMSSHYKNPTSPLSYETTNFLLKSSSSSFSIDSPIRMLPTLEFPRLSHRARAMWRSCLASAFRTAFACSIVGCASLFGSAPLRRQIEFPAFSYATVIIVINGAALGDTVRGCWQAACATVLGVCPAILSLWVIGPTRLSIGNIAAAVALSAFVVGLPESSGLVGKRIALGQIVIVYLLALVKGGETDAVMHPVHVAVSTAVGVLACVLALLLPYPRLASFEVPPQISIGFRTRLCFFLYYY